MPLVRLLENSANILQRQNNVEAHRHFLNHIQHDSNILQSNWLVLCQPSETLLTMTLQQWKSLALREKSLQT